MERERLFMKPRLGFRKQVTRNTSSVHRMGFVAALAVAFLMMGVHASSNSVVGYLYTVNNDTQQNGIAVLERNADASLKEVAGSPFPTRGKGLSGGDIDQQGAI